MISTFVPPLLFMWGAALGSFLNVVIIRSIAGKSIGGRSRCPRCNRQLHWWELIPILSFILLRGRCSTCHRQISVQYPVVELVMGVMALILLQPLPATALITTLAILKLVIAALLVVLFVIDLHTMYLPDQFIVPLLGVVMLHGALTAQSLSREILSLAAEQALLGILIGSGLLGLLWLATRGRGIGLGDVKLMAPLGLLFGPLGTITLLFIAFISGGLLGLVLITTKQASLKTAIPFGPFLIAAAFLLLIYPHLSHYFIALTLGI